MFIFLLQFSYFFYYLKAIVLRLKHDLGTQPEFFRQCAPYMPNALHLDVECSSGQISL